MFSIFSFMGHFWEINVTAEDRESKILWIVKEICSLLGYEDNVDTLYRVSQSDSETKKWNFFEWVHSEKGTTDTDKRWYAIDFRWWWKIVISLNWDLKMKWYARVALKDVINVNHRIWELIMQLKDTEAAYREIKWLSVSIADWIHRGLIKTTKD